MKRYLLVFLALFILPGAPASGHGDKPYREYKDIGFQGSYLYSDIPGDIRALWHAGLASGSDRVSYPRKSLFLHFTPCYSRIYNNDVYNDEVWVTDGGFGYAVEFGYLMRIHRYISLGIGVGISSYQAELNIDDEILEFQDEDIDGDAFQNNLEIKGLTEKTVISSLDIPLFLEFGNANTAKINFYGKIGLKVSYPFSYNFSYDGTYSSEGYYSQYYVTLYGIPELGFVEDAPVEKSDDINLNAIYLSAMVSLGVKVPLSNYLLLKLGGAVNIGLTDLSSEKNNGDTGARYIGYMNSLLTNPDGNSVVQHAGLEVGIIYILESIY